MLRLPIYNRSEMTLAFEFGMLLSEVAKEQGVVLTSEITTRAEEILLRELKTKSWKKVSLEMVPLLLATFEVK